MLWIENLTDKTVECATAKRNESNLNSDAKRQLNCDLCCGFWIDITVWTAEWAAAKRNESTWNLHAESRLELWPTFTVLAVVLHNETYQSLIEIRIHLQKTEDGPLLGTTTCFQFVSVFQNTFHMQRAFKLEFYGSYSSWFLSPTLQECMMTMFEVSVISVIDFTVSVARSNLRLFSQLSSSGSLTP